MVDGGQGEASRVVLGSLQGTLRCKNVGVWSKES
jgi:hypothetical protein